MPIQTQKSREAPPYLKSFRSIIRSDWMWWLPGAAIAFVFASILMTGWPAGLLPNITYPYTYSNDGISQSWLIQRAIEGWIFDNPRSGYPFGSNFLDYPGSDTGNLIVLKLLGLLTGEYFISLNLYFLLGFSITFIASFCVMRSIDLSAGLAFTGAMIFTFLSFHFQRLEHLFYTWYFVTPIFYYAALKIAYSLPSREKAKISFSDKLIYTFTLIALGSFGVYYAFFGIIVILTIMTLGFAREFNFKIVYLSLIAASFVSVGVLLNLTPNLVHQYKNDKHLNVAQRAPQESEVYGLKPIQLVLPRLDHRNSTLAKAAAEYGEHFPLVNENHISSIGIISSIGLLLLIISTLISLSGKPIGILLGSIAFTVFILFMFGVIGGFGSIFALLISPALRGWNRISVFISFGALLGLFLIIQNTLTNHYKGRRYILLSSIIAGAILFIGLYDQTTSTCVNCNLRTKNFFNMDKNFILKIEESLPDNSAVYQLPYMAFPEVPPLYHLSTYGLATPFLHSSSLRWSYGGMKGSDGDLFYRYLSQESLEKQIEVIEWLGFAGIYIDRRGFSDNAEKIVSDLTVMLDRPPSLERTDGEIVFFQLNPDRTQNIDGLQADQIMEKAGYFVDHLGIRYDAELDEGIDFSRVDFPIFVRDIHGLSGHEPLGRWSDANLSPSVRIDFREPLPNQFSMVLSGYPFGPNTDQELKVRIGSQIHKFRMGGGPFEFKRAIDLGNERITQIEFIPPQPTSPKQLGISADNRKLGIWFSRLSFEK